MHACTCCVRERGNKHQCAGENTNTSTSKQSKCVPACQTTYWAELKPTAYIEMLMTVSFMRAWIHINSLICMHLGSRCRDICMHACMHGWMDVLMYGCISSGACDNRVWFAVLDFVCCGTFWCCGLVMMHVHVSVISVCFCFLSRSLEW